jgi:FHS family L-fucose permease-like MFS transporter
LRSGAALCGYDERDGYPACSRAADRLRYTQGTVPEIALAIVTRNVSAPGVGDDYQVRTDPRAMSVAISLFFMVGFLTCLNDIVSPHLKSIFALSYSQVQSIPFWFFSSYFVFSYPGGKLVERFGYKKAMVAGLLVMSAGALGFLPAAHFAVFSLFLVALVILAAGMTIVQVAINPYVTVIGPAGTAASRLNLAQAFNSVGTFIAPFIGTELILKHAAAPLTSMQILSMSAAHRQAYRLAQAATVRMPYMLIALALLLLALALMAIKLRSTTGVSEHTQDFRPGAFSEALYQTGSIWKQKWVVLAAIGIFTYVGAEVSIGNLLVSYMGLPRVAGLPEAIAGYFLMVYWGGTMVGRFLGSALLQKVSTGLLLGLNAIFAFALVLISMRTVASGVVATHAVDILGMHATLYIPHSVPFWTMLAVGLCNSILFPSIFTLGIEGLGALTSKGSAVLIAAILGGAIVPKIQGMLADKIGLHSSFIVPALCYIYIAIFGFAAMQRRKADILVPVEPV